MDQLLTQKRLLTRIAIAAALLLIIMLACSLIGSESVSLKSALRPSPPGQIVNPDYEIYFKIRIPRIILACLVGAALACSGVIFQALLRNPFADPYILGISSGAGLGAIIAIISGFTWTLWGRSPIALFAFIGALATVWLVWLIGRWTGRAHTTGLLLAGVVVNAFFSALIMFLSSLSPEHDIYAVIFWLMGTLEETTPLILWLSSGLIAAGLAALFCLSPQLNVITFGEDDARSIGINTSAVRLAAFSISALITAVAVSLSGLVGFVGLIIPHAVRLLFGPDHRQLIPLSAITGAAFFVAADTLARTIVAPAQLPVGVVTAIAGGPFFLILLVKQTRKIGWPAK